MIPAYKKLDKIPKTLELLNFEGEFEVIVAGDLLSHEDKKFLKRRGVILDCSGKRRGKASALNHAYPKAKGELLIFLDSDTQPEDDRFLDTIWKTYKKKNFEIGTGKLMVKGDSLLEKSINVEYMFMNSAMLMGNVFKKAVPICGAFIIIKKDAFKKLGGFGKVIVEDFHLGYKANVMGLQFRYIKDVTAYTSSPKKIKDWVVQRKRWVMGGSQSVGMAKKDILKNLPVSTAAFSSYYPIPSLSIFSSIMILLAMPHMNLAYLLSMTAFLTTGLMLTMNRILKWGLSWGSGISYLIWYGPLLSAFTMLGLVYFAFKKDKPDDWVV
jgi:cellulose synthase/poly-beta-1,6-N-acetylglucosamine synthase-like glycosyltransferase